MMNTHIARVVEGLVKEADQVAAPRPEHFHKHRSAFVQVLWTIHDLEELRHLQLIASPMSERCCCVTAQLVHPGEEHTNMCVSTTCENRIAGQSAAATGVEDPQSTIPWRLFMLAARWRQIVKSRNVHFNCFLPDGHTIRLQYQPAGSSKKLGTHMQARGGYPFSTKVSTRSTAGTRVRDYEQNKSISLDDTNDHVAKTDDNKCWWEFYNKRTKYEQP